MVSRTYRFFAAVPRGVLAMLCATLVLHCEPAPAECRGGVGVALELHTQLRPGDRFQGLRLLGSLRLRGDGAAGAALHGLSGLAWDADERLLYALSDYGSVLHLRPHFADGRLSGVDFCGAFALRDRGGRPLSGARADAEGLALRHGDNGRRGDGQLLVVFERVPRIALYSPTGTWSGNVALPPSLRARSAYVTPNQALEALAETRRFGVVTAPERPLRGSAGPRLYAADGATWPYVPVDTDHSGIVDLASTADDQLLLLERRYVSLFQPVIITLVRLELADDGRQARQRVVARFDSSAGWSMDNFEGVARHHGERYFLVSDDNRHPLQLSVLWYVEVLGPADAAPAPSLPPPFAPH